MSTTALSKHAAALARARAESLTEEERQEIGRMGGYQRAANLTAKRRREIALAAAAVSAEVRAAKKKKAKNRKAS